MSQPVLVVRPVFMLWRSLLAMLPYQIFFGGLFTVFAGPIIGDPGPALGWGAAAFLITGILFIIGKKINYNGTLYTVYEDRVVFKNGLFVTVFDTAPFKHVREVVLRQSFLQKPKGFGTIYLAYYATNDVIVPPVGLSSTFGMRFVMFDIEDAQGVYEKIKALADATPKHTMP